MPTKMIHRDNGQTYAYTRLEVEDLEKRGWSVAPAKVRQETPTPVEPQKKKPGPKPKAK